LVLKVAWPDLGWPLLTGGRYSEVAVNTGLTVYTNIYFFFLTSILPLVHSPFGAATYFLGRTLMLSQSPFRYTLFKQLLLDFLEPVKLQYHQFLVRKLLVPMEDVFFLAR
jgi:hypothetical protein